MKRTLTLLLFSFGFLPFLAGCVSAFTYTAEPMTAVVIDAETKKPLEGVVVVANWQLESGTPAGSLEVGQLMVMEAVTGPDGKFTFPGFGPKTVWNRYLVDRDPQLLLFKPGYEYQRLFNPYSSDWALRTRKVRRSAWDGKVIELKPLGRAPSSRLRELVKFSEEIGYFAISRDEPCLWQKLARAIAEINLERTELERMGQTTGEDRTIDQGLLDGSREFVKLCGESARVFLRTLRK